MSSVTALDETLVTHHPQGANQEVLDRQSASLTLDKPPSWDLQALLDSLLRKQERLFVGVAHFLQLDMERLVDVLGEANSKLGGLGIFTTRGYMQQLMQLSRLKVGEKLPW